MKSKLILTTIAITLFAATVVAAPAKLQVSLSISPNRTLPGLSVPLYLRVRNGARALELSPSVRVRATSPAGGSFFTTWPEQRYHPTVGGLDFGLTDEEEIRFILPPNAAVELEVPAVDFTQPSWALDSRLLAVPGEWTLEVFLYEVRDDAPEDPENPEPAGVSNPVKLTIATPTGGDVLVWEGIRGRRYWGMAQKVLTENLDSQYFPYLSTVITRHSTLEKVAIITRAIELHPNSPVVPALRYQIALHYGWEASRVFDDGDFDQAVALAEKGRAELTRLKNSKNAWSRLKGNEQLGEFPSREYFLFLQGVKRRAVTKEP